MRCHLVLRCSSFRSLAERDLFFEVCMPPSILMARLAFVWDNPLDRIIARLLPEAVRGRFGEQFDLAIAAANSSLPIKPSEPITE